MATLRLRGVHPLIAEMIADTAPAGVSVSRDGSEVECRSLNVDVNVDLNIAIDVTKITAMAFAAWLTSRLARRPEVRVEVNGKQRPVIAAEIQRQIEQHQ